MDKNLKQPPRFCKYIKCRKLLPKNAPTLKKYCKDTDCSYRQNKIESQARRDATRATKKPKVKTCRLDECENTFELQKGKELQAYCSDECRDEQRRLSQRENFEKNYVPKQRITKKEDDRADGRVTKQDFDINPRFLVRNYSNTKGSNQVATMVGMNA